jgi:protein gp37
LTAPALQLAKLQIATKTGESWNPWMSCHKLGTGPENGCKFCYMFREVRAKQRIHPDWDPNVVRKCKTTWRKPYRLKDRQMIFTTSWSDFFIREADAPGWRDHAWKIIRENPQHVFRICTKRVERIRPPNGPSLLPDDWDNEWNGAYRHVWLGVTVEHQKWVWRMDMLRRIPCSLRWVSAEPLLSELKLDLSGFSFVVDGGESGGRDENGNWEKIRPADPDWFRSLRDQCANHNPPVLYCHKQHGGLQKCSKKLHKQLLADGKFTTINQPFPDHLKSWGCRVLDGRLHDDFPPMPPYP